jgi:hypothetical protein
MKHHLNPRHKIFSQDDIQEASGMFVSLAYSKKRKLVEFCYPKPILNEPQFHLAAIFFTLEMTKAI